MEQQQWRRLDGSRIKRDIKDEVRAAIVREKEMEYVEKIAEKINNISVSGNGMLIDQLRQIFVTRK